MPPKCDLDACSLKGDINDIKKNQAAMTKANYDNAVVQGKFVQKMDDFLEQYEKNEDSNKEERDILFTRTRGIVTLKGLVLTLTVVSISLGILVTILSVAGVI